MSLLTQVIEQPERLSKLTPRQWNELLSLARYARLLGTINALIEEQSIGLHLPQVVREVLAADKYFVEFLQLQAHREFRALQSALSECGFPIVLLKGGAYICAGMRPGKGRRLSDVDILVQREHLDEAEQRLLQAGWQADDSLSDYDRSYYRQWSHEIPPLRHSLRAMEVDLHHNLTQPSGRIKLDPSALWDEVLPIGETGFYRLSDRDMFLHSATHLFVNDELRGGLRDMVDMHYLAQAFGEEPEFWDGLAERAEEMGLTRPLFYAVDGLQRLFLTPIPELTKRRIQAFAPLFLVRIFMTTTIHRILAPSDTARIRAPVLEFMLYIRSHWIRMPPLILAQHLWRKWRFRQSQ